MELSKVYDVVAEVDDALLLENKEETNVFPVCLAEEETFNAFAVALLCICLRVRVCRADYSSKICDVCTYIHKGNCSDFGTEMLLFHTIRSLTHKKRLNFIRGRKKHHGRHC